MGVAVMLGGCAPGGAPVAGGSTAGQGRGAALSAEQRDRIGRKIWQNECGGTVAGLTSWNAGEEFPSLGIGHFIWYPAGYRGRFKESWPDFVAFAVARGAVPPAVARERHSPWRSKREFEADVAGPRMVALRSWLASQVALQTDFIVARSRASLPVMLAAAPAGDRGRIAANFRKVGSTPQGTYALIDYVNFKGDGTVESERYRGQGWGLLQVLAGMREVPAGAAAAVEFGESAKRVLSRRVANAPPERGEAKWLPGWHNRCATYGKPW